jgi:hypothetical protein
MAETVTLEFVARQLERVLAEQAATRDDLRVLTSIVLRHETMIGRLDDTMRATLEQIRAMVAQHQRFDARLRRLEEQTVP